MKTRVSKHFVIPINFPCLTACLLSCLLMSVFLFILWLGLCVDVAVDRISWISISPPPSLLPHHHHHHIIITFIYTRQKHQAKIQYPSLCFFVLFLFLFFFSSYPQFSLKHKWQLFEISARLNLASVPFSSLHFVIGHLEKRFPESIL